jgi:serine/threonine-protein kinase
MGKPVDAAEAADALLRRMNAWPAAEAVDADPRPALYAAAARGGVRTPAERDAARAEWRAQWDRQTGAQDRPIVWLEGYAIPAVTPEDAQTALAVLPDYAPIPSVLTIGSTAPLLGKVYALGGRSKEAIPELQRATASCAALEEPIEMTRGKLLLGEALEATGETDAACAAYKVVLSRWGAAKPRSVSADAARAHAKALRCVL